MEEKTLKEEKIKEIKYKIEQIKNLQFNIDTNNKDSTNFVAAEMGFLIEHKFKNDDHAHNEYYHYPLTYPLKNTFSIHDLQDESFNYVHNQNKKLLYGNHLIDHVIINNTIKNGRVRSDPSNDYHSECALLVLFNQISFQEKMINKFIKDLNSKNLNLIKLKKLILEIHSTNDICDQCFQKVKYLTNWKENKETHIIKYFINRINNMLKDKKITNQEDALNLEVKIIFSYDKDYDKQSRELNDGIIRFKVDDSILIDNDACGKSLSKYSIITSGGGSKTHNNYSYSYNHAVSHARINAANKIINAWKDYKLSRGKL